MFMATFIVDYAKNHTYFTLQSITVRSINLNVINLRYDIRLNRIMLQPLNKAIDGVRALGPRPEAACPV